MGGGTTLLDSKTKNHEVTFRLRVGDRQQTPDKGGGERFHV